MTPPDSGEHGLTQTARDYIDEEIEMLKDSGEREVRCSFFIGDGRCVLSAGHDGRHALLWESAPVAILPLDLAQRTIAALDKRDSALAAELRACVEGKS